MNHMDFGTYLIREHNAQIRREVNLLRLEKRLRKSGKPYGLPLAALGEWGRILIGRTKLTE